MGMNSDADDAKVSPVDTGDGERKSSFRPKPVAVGERARSPIAARTFVGLIAVVIVIVVVLLLVDPSTDLWLGATRAPEPTTTTTRVSPRVPVTSSQPVAEKPSEVEPPVAATNAVPVADVSVVPDAVSSNTVPEAPVVVKPLSAPYQRLRDIYETSLAGIQGGSLDADERNRRIGLLSKKYVEHLNALRERLTRVGKFGEAAQVRTEAVRVQGSPAVAAARGALKEKTAASEETPDRDAPVATPVLSPEAVKPVVEELPPTPVLYRKRPPGIDGARFAAVSLKVLGTTVYRGRIEVDALLSTEPKSDGSAREMSGMKYSRTERETAYRLRLGLRMLTRQLSLENIVIGVQYFMASREGNGTRRETPQQVAVELVRIPKLDTRSIYVDFPPVMIKESLFNFQTDAYRKVTTDGRTFHGIVVTVFRSDGRVGYQVISHSSLKQVALKQMPTTP